MEKKICELFHVNANRIDIHKHLDAYLDMVEHTKLVEGRESAIKELMPQTVQFQQIAKMNAKKARKDSKEVKQ